MIRFICRETNNCDAVHVGGPVIVRSKTFTDQVALEAWLRERIEFASREVIGVELIEELLRDQLTHLIDNHYQNEDEDEAPPAIPHADQDKARNARSVGTGAVTEAQAKRLEHVHMLLRHPGRHQGSFVLHPEITNDDLVLILRAVESAAHHAAEGARPQASGETGDARDAARWRMALEMASSTVAVADGGVCIKGLRNGVVRALTPQQFAAGIDRAIAARSHSSEGIEGADADGNAEGKL